MKLDAIRQFSSSYRFIGSFVVQMIGDVQSVTNRTIQFGRVDVAGIGGFAGFRCVVHRLWASTESAKDWFLIFELIRPIARIGQFVGQTDQQIGRQRLEEQSSQPGWHAVRRRRTEVYVQNKTSNYNAGNNES